MKRTAPLILALLLAVTVSAHVRAQSSGQTEIEVDHPWARATPGGAKTGAAYMSLINNSATADRLLSAATPVAAKIQFHTVSEMDGISQMREIRSVDLIAGGKVTFSPGGLHIMLVDLKQPLRMGETFPMTLSFEKAGKVDVTVAVAKIGAMHPGGPRPKMHQHDDDTMKH